MLFLAVITVHAQDADADAGADDAGAEDAGADEAAADEGPTEWSASKPLDADLVKDAASTMKTL